METFVFYELFLAVHDIRKVVLPDGDVASAEPAVDKRVLCRFGIAVVAFSNDGAFDPDFARFAFFYIFTIVVY